MGTQKATSYKCDALGCDSKATFAHGVQADNWYQLGLRCAPIVTPDRILSHGHQVVACSLACLRVLMDSVYRLEANGKTAVQYASS